MGKIGDLWVRLGLKKQDFDKGIEQAERRLGGLGKAFKAMKDVAIGAFALIAAAAITAFKNVALESNKLGDQWKEVMGGMQNAWNAFTDALLNWDWDDFWARISGAYTSGKGLARASDNLTEQLNSLKMRRADVEQENARLRIEMINQNKSYEERAAAAKKYLDNIEPLYQEEANILRRYYKDMAGAWLNAAGLDANSVTFDALEQFLKGGARLTAEMANDPNMVKIAKKYQAFGDKDNNPLVEAYVAAKEAAGAFEAENRRVFNSLNTATSQIGGGGRGNNERDQALKILKNAQDSLKGKGLLMAENFESDLALLKKYGLSPVERTKQYVNEMVALLDDGKIDVSDGIEDLEDEFNNFEIDTSYLDDIMENFNESFAAGIDESIALAQEFKQAVAGGISDAVQELTDQLFGLEDVNPGRIFQALLSPLADMAVREGEIVMATGLGVEAVKESLESLQGVPALVAGAALIAIGGAAKSGLAALANGGSSTTSSYSGSGGNIGSQTLRSELVVRVEGTIKGRDIVISGQQTINDQNR